MFAKKNESVKAFQSYISKKASRGDADARYVHNLAFYSAGDDDSRPGRHNMTQEEVCTAYSRKYGGHCGATKRTHIVGEVVVKRYKWHGMEFWGEGCGNQLIDEVNCWNKLANTPDADYLCPVLKYFTCKSDKVTPLSDKMKERVVIIAQRAVFVSNLADACKEAERRNREEGLRGTRATVREERLNDLAKRMHWRDVKWNSGNSGVIFDYYCNCYKAVFIDYAL